MEWACWWNGHVGGTGMLVEWACWWNGHAGGTGILPVINIFGRPVPTLATKKMKTRPWVVRYGAGCLKTGPRC
ncbi:hypothetical protein [Moorena sp. SIO3E8]|uniref:hypothetical protein n=1 Tax=Moorena sp. SIO3E8 TaxID=2607830 RepID=UPI001401B9E0|nr:hypothetical protein [Moorena sp. SIO3E8]NEQ03599.1 hypothetical protein [Moorena sp. SIO3F7]